MNKQWKPFEFFKIDVPMEIREFFLDVKNYPEIAHDLLAESYNLWTKPPIENHPMAYLQDSLHKNLDIAKKYTDLFDTFIPKERLPPNYQLQWEASLIQKGHQIFPHIEFEYKTRDGVPKVGIGKFLFWITPEGGYVGRDFVWGRYKGEPKLTGDTTYFLWDHEGLQQDGSLHPTTGDACLFRLEDSHYYHAVTELLSDTAVATISSFIYV